MKKRLLLVLCGLSFIALSIQGQVTLLHEFAGGIDDGKWPYGDLLISGSTLYGMTHLGGNGNLGTIFKMQFDGSDFTPLHRFAGPPVDGQHPVGNLILFGSTLYGMTNYGGKSHMGTIFKIQTDGSGFALVHSFAGGATDGRYPNGS
ncbi:MAG: hypothetical protein M0C28_19230 [Candidatus Moduliflexus flocculans]|nr:hypothetical protein [Candidatus Moduliflexus flocculans]